MAYLVTFNNYYEQFVQCKRFDTPKEAEQGRVNDASGLPWAYVEAEYVQDNDGWGIFDKAGNLLAVITIDEVE